MKKIFIVYILTVLCFFSCQSMIDYEQPTINIPHTYIIDSYMVQGNMEDNVRLISKSQKPDISFKVYIHDPETMTWIIYGTALLTGFDDTSFVRSGLSGDLDSYRYFAIEASDGQEYKYEFKKLRNDLYIYIFDKQI